MCNVVRTYFASHALESERLRILLKILLEIQSSNHHNSNNRASQKTNLETDKQWRNSKIAFNLRRVENQFWNLYERIGKRNR